MAVIIRRTLPTALRNLAMLMFLVLPIFFMLVLMQAFVSRSGTFRDVPDALTFAAMTYISTAAPVCAAGLLHQVACLLLPQGWPPAVTRVAVFGGALLIPVVTVLVSFDLSFVADTISAIAIPSVISSATYAAVMRLPQATRDANPPS